MRTLLAGLLLCVASAARSQSTITAIRAGRLIDPDAGTVATNQIILVDSGRFKAIGPTVAIPAGGRHEAEPAIQ